MKDFFCLLKQMLCIVELELTVFRSTVRKTSRCPGKELCVSVQIGANELQKM